MAEETVTITAALKDQMSAPLDQVKKKVDGVTDAVVTGSRKQSAAADKSTAQIGGSIGKQNRLFAGMQSTVSRATTGTSRLFSGMAGAIRRSLDGLPEYSSKQGEKTASAFGNSMKSGMKLAAGAVATYFGAQMIGGFVAEAGRASDATDKFKATMNFAGIDTKGIDAATKASKAYADQTVYDLPTIQNTFAQLASNGVKGYEGITKAAGNLNAVAGGNAETFKSVSRTLTQSAGAGKLMTEDWNMLADAIPGASGPLQKAMKEAGAFEGNFKKAMENGEISADEFQSAIMKLGNQPIAVEAAKSTKTFEGALGNLNATINSKLMSALDKIKPAATIAIGALSTGLGKALDWAGDAAQGLYDLIVKGDFSGAFSRAFNVEEDSPLVDLLFDLREAAVKLPDLVGKVATKLYELRTPIGIIVGLITAVFIPHWAALATAALLSAGKQKTAWIITQTQATKAAAVHSGAVMVMIGGWIALGAQATWHALKVAAAWLIAMGPVGWIIAGLVAIGAALVWAYNNVDWFRAGVDAAFKWIGEAVQNVGKWFTEAFQNVVNWWNTTLLPAIQAVGKWFTDVFNGVIGWWNGTLLPAISAVGQWFSDMFTQVGNFLRDFVGFFVDGWGMLVDFFNGVLMPAIQAVGDFFAPILDWINRLIWNAMTIAVFLFQKLVDFWNGVLLPAVRGLADWFTSVFTWLWEGVLKPMIDNTVAGFQALGDFLATIFNWIWTFAIRPVVDFIVGAFRSLVDFWNLTLIPAFQAVGDFIGTVMNWIYTTLIKPVIDFIVAAFRSIVDFWNLTLIPGLQALSDFIGTTMTWIYETLIKPVIDLIVAAFTTLTDFWNNTLSPMITTVAGWFSDTIGGAINGVGDFIDDLKKGFDAFIKFWSDTLKPVVDAIADAFNIVKDAINGALDGIGKFANNPLGGIQDMLGIQKDENGQGIMPTNSGGGVYPGNGVRFAGGGVLGGYAPGRDSILARLSPGESVLVPELTRAIGPQNIMAANAAASGGRPAGSGPALTSGHSGAARSGAAGAGTQVINAPVTITVNAPNGVGAAELDQIRAAVEEIFDNERRRSY
jgi:tape measure domain-containing protein